ncbi:MAG: precorrin-6A reductase [Planctomycetes bacterium]|nr:precorrin-6A reductase [Planctomycetota bacterium]
MILLLGGTSETAALATGLAEAGYPVLVSTATEIPLETGRHPAIRRRSGRLDAEGLAAIVREEGIRAVVDATHPFATVVHATARETATRLSIPYLRFERPHTDLQTHNLFFAEDHPQAARIAFSFGRAVLLTTGSKVLEPYVSEARRTGTALAARVLPHPQSLEACRAAGLPDGLILTGRGPFSVEENRSAIRQFGIGVLVTKDSGAAGGVPEKIAAARLEGCCVVVVRRPAESTAAVYSSVPGLIEALLKHLQDSPGRSAAPIEKLRIPIA